MTFRRMRFAIALAGAGLAIAVGTAPQAQAITLTIDSIAKQAGDTGNYSQNNSTNAGEWLSATSVINGGGSTPDAVSASLAGQTRYASVIGSDADAANFSSRNDSANSVYRVIFTVTPDYLVGTTYDVTINTARFGALVVRDEGSGNGGADISGVTGTISNAAIGSLNLPDIAGINSGGTVVTAINQVGTAFTVVGLSGVQTFQLDFSWNQNTTSANNILSGAGEGVVLLGLPGTASRIGAADDYPGTSGRTQSGDGHFVNIDVNVTAVPEPASLAMAGIGGLGLAFVAFRSRRKSA